MSLFSFKIIHNFWRKESCSLSSSQDATQTAQKPQAAMLAAEVSGGQSAQPAAWRSSSANGLPGQPWLCLTLVSLWVPPAPSGLKLYQLFRQTLQPAQRHLQICFDEWTQHELSSGYKPLVVLLPDAIWTSSHWWQHFEPRSPANSRLVWQSIYPAHVSPGSQREPCRRWCQESCERKV